MSTERTPLVGDLSKASDLDDPVRTYKLSIPKVPYNSLEQDLALGRDMWLMKLAQRALSSPKKLPLDAGDHEYLESLISKGVDAIEKITTPCLYMAFDMAMTRYDPSKGIPPMEYIGEANTALMNAAKYYNFRKGFKFTTYAQTAIERHITNMVRKEPAIRLRRGTVEFVSVVYAKWYQYHRDHGEWPTDQQLAEITGLPEKKIAAILNNGKIQPISFDAPQRNYKNDGDQSDLLETASYEGAPPTPEEYAEESDLRSIIRKALKSRILSKREAEIMILRHGLDGSGVGLTLEETGKLLYNNNEKKMGVTRESVRQNEAKAKAKLQRLLRRRGIRHYLEF